MTTIKLGKNEDIVSVIKKIKDLREKEVVFELEKGSLLLSSSANLKLMKRTGETLGKKILVTTTDDLGRLLAIKAGVLADQTAEDLRKMTPNVGRKSTPQGSFGDMRVRKTKAPAADPEEKLTSGLVKKYLPQGIPAISKSRFGRMGKTVVLAVLAAIIIGTIAFVVLPRADIKIFARSEPITRDVDLRVDKNATTAGPNSLVIPGLPVSNEISQTKNFPVTGTKLSGVKARGSVTITNGTSNTLRLRAATTTLVANGKKYFFTADASGIAPGSSNVSVDIVAEEAGEAYNLPVNTRFEIQNTALGNQPSVYATSNSAISGGAATATLALTQSDLDSALARSTEELIATAEKELNDENPGWRLIPSGVKTEILAQAANKNIGDEVDSFDFTVIARITGLAFREDDVKNLISGQIRSVLSDDKYLVEGAKQKVDATFKSTDLAAGTGSLSVHFETIVAYKIDVNNLTRLLAGKRDTEIREILLSKPEIDRVDVKLWPFFVNRAPKFNGKVNITTVLSQL